MTGAAGREEASPRRPGAGGDASSGRGQRLRRKLREEGLPRTLLLVLDRALPRRLIEVVLVTIVEMDLAAPPGDEADPSGIRWSTPADLDGLAVCGRDPATIRARLERGARAAVLEANGRPVAFEWYQTERHASEIYDWLRVRLPPRCVFGFDAVVLPEFRGRGCIAKVRSFARREYAGAGFERLLGGFLFLNRSALRASRKSGFRPVGRIFCLRLPGLQLIRLGGRPGTGLWRLNRREDLPLAALGGGRGG